MLGFDLDIGDYLTFLALMVSVLGALAGLVWLAGLPGRIAIARKHPDAEAVKLLGYAGFLPVVPWIQAAVTIVFDDADQSKFPIGAGGEAAIYTKGMTGSWAALRRIGIRTTSWSNFLYPMPI